MSTWNLIDKLLKIPANEGNYRMLLSGKPGIGKTMTPIKTLRADGTKVFIISLTEDTPHSELKGSFQLKGNEFVWADGLLIKAWRESASGKVAVVINEIDKAPPDVMSFMHAYLDDQTIAEIHLPTGEVIRPTIGNFRVIATMNGKFEELPDPIQSRFPVNVEINEVHPEALASLPDDLQQIAKAMTENEREGGRSLSIREFKAFDALRKTEGLEDTEAAAVIFGKSGAQMLTAVAMGKKDKEAKNKEAKK